MSIVVNIHQTLRHLTNNQATVDVHGNTVGECLEDLLTQFPNIKDKLFNKKGTLLNYVDIYVNLEMVDPDELTRPVNDGDVIHIVMMLTGG